MSGYQDARAVYHFSQASDAQVWFAASGFMVRDIETLSIIVLIIQIFTLLLAGFQ